jgi:predicted Ser/Thr protein kinase
MEVRNIELRKMGTFISKYRVENLIAAGTFGKVYLATLNGKKYAIK